METAITEPKEAELLAKQEAWDKEQERKKQEEIDRVKRQEEESKKLYAKGEKRFKELERYGLQLKVEHYKRDEGILLLANKTEEQFTILRDDWIKDAEDNKKAAAERAELLKPDKERLTAFLKELKALKIPALKTDEGKRLAMEVATSLKDLIADTNEKVKNL